ncbi:MAG: acetylornithine deacetylase [Rhizobiaceae bacterium]|nr:acetylornithine deacetylase [Rhizobiaceae bacterium]
MSGQTYSQIEMIEKLVGFPTVSCDSNLPLVEFVREYLSAWGIESQFVYNEEGNKANLYATVGPNVEGGIVLSGHTDVVPVEGQAWVTDPFKVTQKEGRLYGRGTADMKSFSAIGLSLVPEMLKADLKRPIHFALSYDEEVACLGAPDMIAEMGVKCPPALGVIVGEPTEMRTVTAHKAIADIVTKVRGHEVHSSLVHTGVSAVMVAARLITWWEDRMREGAVKADPNSLFDPPYSTFHCGQIEGGTAHNITAKDCWFVTDIRTVPGETPHQHLDAYYEHLEKTVIPAMKAIHPDCNVETEIIADVPGLRPEQNGDAESFVRSITGDNSHHVVAYGTEGGQFQDGGFSTVVCGPGSIEQAHQPNEFIEVSQVEAGTEFLRKVIARCAA